MGFKFVAPTVTRKRCRPRPRAMKALVEILEGYAERIVHHHTGIVTTTF